jgi:hypothetical protein
VFVRRTRWQNGGLLAPNCEPQFVGFVEAIRQQIVEQPVVLGGDRGIPGVTKIRESRQNARTLWHEAFPSPIRCRRSAMLGLPQSTNQVRLEESKQCSSACLAERLCFMPFSNMHRALSRNCRH